MTVLEASRCMRLLTTIIVICHSSFLTGCSLFGYYKPRKAERASPEETEKVVFPNSYEKGLYLDGPTMAALDVARNEFMPLGIKVKAHNEELARCLLRRDTYDVSILKANDNLYFISFSANLDRCGINTENFILLDAGATYAIDGQGRVLSVQ